MAYRFEGTSDLEQSLHKAHEFIMANKPGETITINVEKAGALVVGNQAPVTINVGNETAHGFTVDASEAAEMEKIVQEIAAARGGEPASIKAELAKALGLPDYSFIVVNVLPDAMKLLRAWRETEVRNAVNAAGGKH